MNQHDALKVLGLSGQVSPESIKLAYKKACSKYHPDRNPAGLEIMKMVNVAYVSWATITSPLKVGFGHD